MSVFDVLGPVMIGPSSFHTAGTARIGRITLALLGAPAVKADTFLHGSFVKTYKDHGTDEALVADTMGMTIDDSRTYRASELAREQGLKVSIATGEIDGAHPDTVRVTLTDITGNTISLLGNSIGGDNILIEEVNGMKVSVTDQHTTLTVLHRDTPGTIMAVTEVMVDARVDIHNFHLSRQNRGGETMMTIKIDGSFGPELNEKIKALPNIFSNAMPQPI